MQDDYGSVNGIRMGKVMSCTGLRKENLEFCPLWVDGQGADKNLQAGMFTLQLGHQK